MCAICSPAGRWAPEPGYPKKAPVADLIANWNPDDMAHLPAKVYRTICRFDAATELDKAYAYLEAEVCAASASERERARARGNERERASEERRGIRRGRLARAERARERELARAERASASEERRGVRRGRGAVAASRASRRRRRARGARTHPSLHTSPRYRRRLSFARRRPGALPAVQPPRGRRDDRSLDQRPVPRGSLVRWFVGSLVYLFGCMKA